MEIDTYGNVDSLYYVMQGVASFMGSGTWTGLIRYTLLCGVVIWTVVAIGRKGTEIFRWFAGAMLMTQLLLAPVENVFISDVNNVQPTREVDHVPVFLAALAQGFTPISRVLTQSYETVFSVPDSLTLKKGDVGFGISVLKKVNQAEITDPGLHADLMQFFKECTVYDIQDGAIDPKTIMNGTDPFNTVFTSTSPARYVTTNTLTANPTTDTCTATGTLLLIRVQDAEQSAEQIYGSEMYPEISDPGTAKAAFVNAIGDSYGFILQSSQNASSALRQAMFNNVWRQAGAELPAMLNDPARVAEVNALMSSAQAAVATNGSLASVAILAKDTLPTVRNYAEAVIYAVCPLVLIMCLVSGGDAAKKILAMYGKTIGWVSLWPVLFAMINGLSMIRLSHVMHSMSLQNGVPFGMAAKFGSTLIDEQALLGYMVIIVPVLAWGILNVASAGLNGAFSMLTGAVTGSAQQIGGQQAQGNESIGNVHMDSSSIDSASRNVTSANKFDNTVQSRTGSMNVDTGTGSAFTNFSNGLIARTDYQNSLGVSATSQQAFERSLGTDSSTGVSSNQTSSAFSGREQIASGTTSVSNSQERGTTQRVADDSTSGTRGSTSQSGERRTSVDQQYGVDQSHSVEGQTSAGGKISGMLGGVFEKSFGEDVPAGTGSPNPGGGRQAPGGKGAPGPANPAANSPLFNQAEEDKLARKAESLGKSPQEVQAIRDAYRSKVTAADYATGGGTGKGKSSARIGLDISGEGGYMRFWRNSDAEKFVDQYGSLGAFSENDQYTREGSQIHTDSTGMDSGQHTRSDRSASLTDQASSGSRVAADLSRSADVRQRGSTQTVSRVDTSTNLMTPENLQKVAARNGMRYSQLMTLSGDDLARLVSEDASMRDIVSRNSTLPTTARDGSALPTRQADVVRQNRTDRGSVGSGEAAAYQGFAGAVGPADTSALNVSTPMPEVVSDAQQRVDAMKQRVSTDAAAPITQVNAHVDPSSDNKPLMTPERAPARPLPLPASPPPLAASAQASDSPVRAPFDAWRSDIAPSPLPSGSAAPPAAVERFLHSGAATTGSMPADGRMASPKPSSGSSAAHLSESDFRIVTLDAGSAGPSPEGERQRTQPSSGSPARVASSPMQPMTAKAVNFGAPFAPGAAGPVPVGDLTGDASIPGRSLGESHSAQPMTPGTPGASSFPSAPAGPRELAPSRPSLPAGGGEIASTEGDLGKARSTLAGIGSLNEKARSEKPDPSAGNAAGAPSQIPMASIERAESSEQSVAGSNQTIANGPATSPSALPSPRQLARGAGNSNGELSVAPNRQADTNDK
ncbi:conjugal transfer protein TraG N-terminal domain-containing protein [Burkholderia gladioli]|uniref:conjugal transfer protein TraG N-terminal domain-containing protein n=1 Tax=Burkholderia gladioli TaxID=28095 RepID=UPI000B2273A1|nr:conjugal transfer protein TraG N-terminal domain-containing protein [Burkholderia gladioli]